MDLIQNLIAWLYWYFRPAIKWFLRQTTRLCELQRICYGETPGAQRSCAVGKFQKITFLNIFMLFRRRIAYLHEIIDLNILVKIRLQNVNC